MAHEAQGRCSSLVLAKMRSENILKDGIIFNNDYEGDPVAGAVKVPVRDGGSVAGDYDRSAGGASFPESSTEYRYPHQPREASTSLWTATTRFPTTPYPWRSFLDRICFPRSSRQVGTPRQYVLRKQSRRQRCCGGISGTPMSAGRTSRTTQALPACYLDIYAAMLKAPPFVQASALATQ